MHAQATLHLLYWVKKQIKKCCSLWTLSFLFDLHSFSAQYFVEEQEMMPSPLFPSLLSHLLQAVFGGLQTVIHLIITSLLMSSEGTFILL